MKRVSAILGASGLVLALSLPSWAQDQTTPDTYHHPFGHRGDHRSRQACREHQDGRWQVRDARRAPGAKRFDELKVGDKVSVTYNNNVSVRLKPPGEAAVDTGSATTTAGQGARPGGTIAVERTMTATIDAIDKSASSITFVGPNGFKYSRHVVDPTVFDKVKVGDKVDITWNTDLTVSVE